MRILPGGELSNMARIDLNHELEVLIGAVDDAMPLMPEPVQAALYQAIKKLEEAEDILEGLSDG